MLGDFNFPDINWINPDLNCSYAIPLISLSDCLFLNQQVLVPTRKSNILYLIFSLDDFINHIDVTDSVYRIFVSSQSKLQFRFPILLLFSNP